MVKNAVHQPMIHLPQLTSGPAKGFRWKTRVGFSAVELLVVLGIAITIISSATPAILSTLRKNAVSRGADTILAVAEQARRMSRNRVWTSSTPPAAPPSYGVQIDVSGSNSVTISLIRNIAGTTKILSESDLDATAPDHPFMQKFLNNNSTIFNNTQMNQPGKWTCQPVGSGATITWLYESGTGRVINTSGALCEIGTGVGASCAIDYQTGMNLTTSATIPAGSVAITPLNPVLGVTSLDGAYGIGIAIFNIGIGYAHELH